ncbi:MAG TPA: hypothetical protein VGH87_02640 [Polyangiaceae bacterium]|nr:hypothetical protein [Polyangiaceae bacterium]
MAAIACLMTACAAESPHETTPVQELPKPVVASPAPSTPRAPSPDACVMLYECGCNAGCTKIDRSIDALAPGMQVGILSGPLKGTTVFVAKNHTDTGEAVFTVQRADPSSPIMVCGVPRSPTIGYLCGTKDLAPPRTCGKCSP